MSNLTQVESVMFKMLLDKQNKTLKDLQTKSSKKDNFKNIDLNWDFKSIKLKK